MDPAAVTIMQFGDQLRPEDVDGLDGRMADPTFCVLQSTAERLTQRGASSLLFNVLVFQLCAASREGGPCFST